MLGDVREQLGEYEEGIEAYRRAAALVPADPVVRADLLLRRARARMHLGAYRLALAEATKGRRLLADRVDAAAAAVRARLTALQALLRQAQQRAALALDLAERAIAEARAAGDDTALARAYLVSDWANRILGVTDAEARGERALELYERLGDLDGAGKASNNLGGIAYYDGRWDDAVRWYRRALDAYHRCGDEAMAAVTASNLGELLTSRGAFDEAEEMLRDSIRVLRSLRALDDVLFTEIQLGRLLVERGQPAAAVDHLVAVRAEAIGLGQVGYAFEAAMYLASGLAALGRFDQAFATLDEAVAGVGDVDPVYQATLARVRAEALAGTQRYDEARAALDDGLAVARDQGLEYEEALLLRDSTRLDRAVGRSADQATVDAMTAIFTRLNLDLDLDLGDSIDDTDQDLASALT
jgi:tetratricopeptide (TPR) repeat protein